MDQDPDPTFQADTDPDPNPLNGFDGTETQLFGFMLRVPHSSAQGLGSSPTAWHNKLKFLEHALNAYLLLVDGNILTFFFMTSHILGAPPPGVTEPSPPL